MLLLFFSYTNSAKLRTYDYDCGNGHKVKFKFRVYSSIKQVSVPWPIYKYLLSISTLIMGKNK